MPKSAKPPARLEEGRDYYFDESGLMVLTGAYLQARGYCCGNICRHCPYPKAEQSAAAARLKAKRGQ